MCLVITGMVPTPSIDVDAPFALAFRDRGMAWAESVISLGAVAAITTALLSSLMGQPRVYMVMARDGLLPDWFARVHPKLGTPANATAFTGTSVRAPGGAGVFFSRFLVFLFCFWFFYILFVVVTPRPPLPGCIVYASIFCTERASGIFMGP